MAQIVTPCTMCRDTFIQEMTGNSTHAARRREAMQAILNLPDTLKEDSGKFREEAEHMGETLAECLPQMGARSILESV